MVRRLRTRSWKEFLTLTSVVLACGSGWLARAQTLPEFDFTQAASAQGWVAAHDISSLTSTTNGLQVVIGGADPYLTGPARNYPLNQPLWLRLR